MKIKVKFSLNYSNLLIIIPILHTISQSDALTFCEFDQLRRIAKHSSTIIRFKKKKKKKNSKKQKKKKKKKKKLVYN
jgi:hypothetical protein